MQVGMVSCRRPWWRAGGLGPGGLWTWPLSLYRCPLTIPAWYQILTVPGDTPGSSAIWLSGISPAPGSRWRRLRRWLGADDALDHDGGEGPSFAVGQAAVAQDAGDLGAGVVVQQLVDLSDSGGLGLPDLGRLGDWQGEGAGLTARPGGRAR